MFFITTFQFAKKFLRLLPFIVLLCVIAAVVLGFRTYHTQNTQEIKDNLKAQVVNQKQVNENLKESIATDTKVLDNVRQSNKVTVDTIVQKGVANDALNESIDKLKIQEKIKVEVAKKVYEQSSKDKQALAVKQTSVSLIQVDTLWTIYCQGAPDDQQCKGSV